MPVASIEYTYWFGNSPVGVILAAHVASHEWPILCKALEQIEDAYAALKAPGLIA